MSTPIRNTGNTKIAALALSVAACALLVASDVSAMSFPSMGGQGAMSRGLGGNGLAGIGRSAPMMNRGLNGAAARPLNMGRAGNSVMSGAGRSEGLKRATTPQTSRPQVMRQSSSGHHDAAAAGRDNAKGKPNQVTDNRSVRNSGSEKPGVKPNKTTDDRTGRNSSAEKPPVTGERRPQRTDDLARNHDRNFRDRDDYIRDRDDVPVWIPEIVPLIGTPTVEIVPTNPPRIFVPNGPTINVTRGDPPNINPPKPNPPPLVVPTFAPTELCTDANCQALLNSVLFRQAMLEQLKQDLASDENKLAQKQKELFDYQANLAKAKWTADIQYWTDMIKIEMGSIAAYVKFVARDKELIDEVEGMLRAAITDWQDCVKRRCPDKPGAQVFDQPNVKPDNNPDGPF